MLSRLGAVAGGLLLLVVCMAGAGAGAGGGGGGAGVASLLAEYVNDDRDACGNATLCQEAASTCTGLPWTTLAAIRIVESIGTTRVHDAGLFVLTRLRERL